MLLIILAWLFTLFNKVFDIDSTITNSISLRTTVQKWISLQGLIISLLLGCCFMFFFFFVFLALNITLDILVMIGVCSCSLNILVVIYIINCNLVHLRHRFVLHTSVCFCCRLGWCFQAFAKFWKSSKRLCSPFQLLLLLVDNSTLPRI